MKIIDDGQFLRCLQALKLDTGYDLESIGLTSEVDNFAISIYAKQSTEYRLEIVDFHYKDELGKWRPAKPTLYQYVELKKALKREVELIYGTLEERKQRAEADRKENELEDRYGHPGALYSKTFAFIALWFCLSGFNSSRTAIIQDTVNRGLTELNLDVNVRVRPVSEDLVKQARANGTVLKAHVLKMEGGYIIEVADLATHEINEVVAHELIHIHQFESEDLRVISRDSYVIWKGRRYSIAGTAYNVRPWEIDAEERAPALTRKL